MAPRSEANGGTRRRRRQAALAAGVSLCVHVVALPVILPRLLHPAPAALDVTYVTLDGEAVEKASETSVDTEPPELAQIHEKKPEEDKAEKKPEEKKPFEVVPLPDLPMVDQDDFAEENDNPEAKFLAQKNHRVSEDVQAKDREKHKSGPPPEPQTPDEKKQLPTAPEKTAVLAQAVPTGQKGAPAQGQASSPLQMRGLPGETGPSVPIEEGGTTAASGSDPVLGQAQGRTVGKVNLNLKPADYDRIVGPALAEAERRAGALAERPKTPNRWDRLVERQSLVRTALENFVPNVRIGNQSELGTRRHPFAGFVATVHRQIHQHWGDGFLAAIDGKTGKDAYPESLVAKIEIVIREDGKIDGLIIAKPSGVLPFDTAALDAVASAAPFPAPPDSIKSRDGNVYLTWPFYRDERQCHPNYVEMHILTTPPKAPKAPTSPTGPGLPVGKDRERLLLAQGTGVGGGRAPGPVAAGSGQAAKPEAVATSEASKSATKAPAAAMIPSEAKESAQQWLAAFQKGDIRWLAATSGLPFTAAGKEVAEDGARLRAFYGELLSEEGPRQGTLRMLTIPQMRAALGRLPRGADEPEMVFGWIDLSGEDIILLLAPTDRGFSVVGIERR